MTGSTSSHEHRYIGEEARENKSLEHLVDPVEPIVFDPDPSGSDMPNPSGSAGEVGSEEPADTAD